MNDSYVLKAVMNTPWAILPEKLAVIMAVVTRHAQGERLDPDEIRAQIGAAKSSALQSHGAVAVIPLHGTIFPRANLMTETSGAVSAEKWGAQFRQLVNDPGVSAILIDVDSPGGAVQGVDELSAEIYRARSVKPVSAIANHLAASAGYWLATAAGELVVTPSAEVGSVGVYAMHDDISKALEMQGVKTTYITAGKYKVEGNPETPLDDEARAAIQARVNEYYDMFVRAVARNRGAGVESVRNGFGEGRVVGAKEAVKLGMADRIGTLDETIARLVKSARRSPQAELDIRQRRARAEG